MAADALGLTDTLVWALTDLMLTRGGEQRVRAV
jgi:phage terminase large subunit-like protein